MLDKACQEDPKINSYTDIKLEDRVGCILLHCVVEVEVQDIEQDTIFNSHHD